MSSFPDSQALIIPQKVPNIISTHRATPSFFPIYSGKLLWYINTYKRYELSNIYGHYECKESHWKSAREVKEHRKIWYLNWNQTCYKYHKRSVKDAFYLKIKNVIDIKLLEGMHSK